MQSSAIFSGDPFTYDLKELSALLFIITLILYNLDSKSNRFIIANS